MIFSKTIIGPWGPRGRPIFEPKREFFDEGSKARLGQFCMLDSFRYVFGFIFVLRVFDDFGYVNIL